MRHQLLQDRKPLGSECVAQKAHAGDIAAGPGQACDDPAAHLEAFAFDNAGIVQAAAKGSRDMSIADGRQRMKIADHRQRALLRACRQGARCDTCEQAQNRSPPHGSDVSPGSRIVAS
jgi:hypothetical protein